MLITSRHPPATPTATLTVCCTLSNVYTQGLDGPTGLRAKGAGHLSAKGASVVRCAN